MTYLLVPSASKEAFQSRYPGISTTPVPVLHNVASTCCCWRESITKRYKTAFHFPHWTATKIPSKWAALLNIRHVTSTSLVCCGRGGCEFPHNVMRVEMCTKIQTWPPGFTMFIQKGYKRPQWYKAWSVFTMIPPRGEGRTSIIPVLLKHQHHKGLYNMPRKATARHFSTQLLDTKIKGSVRPVRRAEWDGGRRCVKSDELLELLSQRIRRKKSTIFEMATGYLPIMPL